VEQLSLNPRRIVTLVPAGKDLIAVSTQGEVLRWDSDTSNWDKIFVARGEAQLPFMFATRIVGPLYDAAGERILAFDFGLPGFSPLSASTRLQVGKRADDWRREEGVNVPDGAMALLQGPKGDLLTTSSQGIYRLEGDLAAKQQDINVFGLHIPLPERGGRFVNVGPEVQLRPPQSAAIDTGTGRIALFDGYQLVLFEPDSASKYRELGRVAFDTKLTGHVALAGDSTFLALEGEVRRYNDKLELVDTLSSAPNSLPANARLSPDGRVLAVVYRDGTLWLYDVREMKPLNWSIAGQGDISAVAFDNEAMYVADRLTRVTEYNLPDHAARAQHQPPLPLAEKIYRYALHPLYTVFPKPSELNQTVMLTSKDTKPGAIRLNDNNATIERLDVWGPIWSNLVFLAVVLGMACVYIHRKDF
jgi:hypothetical protein